MPEDVNQQPAIAEELKSIHREVWQPRSAPLELSTRSVEILKERMDSEIARIKALFPDVPEARLDAAIGAAYGHVGVLERDSLNKGKEISKFEKETSARIGHALTHNAIYASSSSATTEEKQAVFDFLRTAQNLRNIRNFQDSTLIAEYFIGIQTETAVARSLLENGYQVFLPDYTQDPFETPEEDNEVLQLDVLSGVDLIAKKGGKVVLVDAKGRRVLTQPEPLQQPRQIDIGFEWNPLLRKTVLDLKPREVYRLILGVPTKAEDFRPADFSSPNQNIDTTLKSFGRLRPDHSDRIKTLVDDLHPRGNIDYRLA